MGARAGAPAAASGGVPPRWVPTSIQSNWFVQDGYLVQIAENAGPNLLLDTPLAGTFEFSVDAWSGNAADGHVGYGGVVLAPGPGQSTIHTLSGNDAVMRPLEGIQYQQFNRLTVQVTPAKVRYQVNSHLVYEDFDPPPTAPWPMLVSGATRPVFRNFILTGEPTVLSEVKLLAGDYLDGWVPRFGTAPQRLLPKEKDRPEGVDQWGRPIDDSDPNSGKEPIYEWRAKDGELLGRKLDRPSDRPVQSQISYFRTLRPGDAVRYEFFHEPGQTHVDPTVGRLAFLLEEGGVAPALVDRRGPRRLGRHQSRQCDYAAG